MQFIPLNNLYAYLRGATKKATNKNWVDTSGTTRTAFNSSNDFIFSCNNSTTIIAPQTTCLFFYAIADATIAHDAYSITQIGTSSEQFTASAGGYNTVITITGSEPATITHLVASRKVYYASSTSAEALLFALKLDTPVELNAENNYTANFTFAIEF